MYMCQYVMPLLNSVADPYLGSCAFVDPWIRYPELVFFRILDLGSQIPKPYIGKLCDNFLGEKFYNS
jgi:hypothetical protein